MTSGKLHTVADALAFAEQAFEQAELVFGHGTDSAWDEAVAALLFVLQLPPDTGRELLSRALSESEQLAFQELVQQRIATRQPLPYLTHEAHFAGLKFYADERALIPRSPLGELIRQQFQPWLSHAPKRILDICTGGGCLAIACAHYFPEAQVDALDLSADALAVAKKNVALHGLQDRVQLFQSDLCDALPANQYDLILSNPPYVSDEEMATLPAEYEHEPVMALRADNQGLAIVDRLLQQIPAYLATDAVFALDVGYTDQALQQAYPQYPFIWVDLQQGGQGIALLMAEDWPNS